MSKRKIIQLVADGADQDNNPELYALCDDGSVWMKVTPSSSWVKVDVS